MNSTDTLQLNKTPMFAKMRAGLPEERQHTMDLLECKDDMLYAWDSVECCLLALNWRSAQLEGYEKVKYQTLIPSSTQTFQVERMSSSHEGSLMALAGSHDVTVLELPRRWGKYSLFLEGKEKITCRATNLDGQFFNNNSQLEVQQIRWHPASPTDSHLLVLVSDNTIRVYNNCLLRHIWILAAIPVSFEMKANSCIQSARALGETAVDFDFGPAMKSSNTLEDSLEMRMSIYENSSSLKKIEKFEWPIVILRGNGNIYILMAGLDTDRPRLQGPITISPQTSDNYGLESCALMVIPSLPPTLIIAECNGNLHHALLLRNDEAFNISGSIVRPTFEAQPQLWDELETSINMQPSQWLIHVLETVELELGLPKDEGDQATSNSCPFRLKRDFINELRYFAYHNTGLHVISINFIAEIHAFLELKGVKNFQLFTNPSSAEYIVCTKIDSARSVNTVLGFVQLQMPSGIVLLLSSGEVISLKLVINPRLLFEKPTPTLVAGEEYRDDDSQQMREMFGPTFSDHIKTLLKRNVNQPLLSVNKSAHPPSSLECYELLTQAMDVMRTQYIKRHESVHAEFSKRMNMIKLRMKEQRAEIETIEREHEQLRERGHRLADRFEEIYEEQQALTQQSHNLIRKANTCLPSNPVTEESFAKEVQKVFKATKKMCADLKKARDSLAEQAYFVKKFEEENALKRTIQLPKRHETTIRDILVQMTAEIGNQIREVKLMDKIMKN